MTPSSRAAGRVLPVVRRRAALSAAFGVNGLLMATWVSRTPAIRDALDASTGLMGLVIAGLSAGSMVGIAVGGTSVARLGARTVTTVGLAASVVGVAVAGLGAAAGLPWLVALGLGFFGLGAGAGEIALNVEGVEVERLVGRTVVPSLHAYYSVGLAGGGLLGLAATSSGLAVLPHLIAVAAVGAAVTAWVGTSLDPTTGREVPGATLDGLGQVSLRQVWSDPRTVGIGIVVLGTALAEGAANDWLPLTMVDGYGLAESTASLVYTGYGVFMATGRFTAGRLLDRFGRVPVMLAAQVAAALGIALVAFSPTITLGALGVALWGLGASLGFPVALSAAGDDPVGAARRVSAVAAMGYLAFLVGPPFLGLVADQVGLRTALVVVLGALAVALTRTRHVAPPAR